MTPNELEILIHCHVSPAPHPRFGAPAVNHAISDLVSNGLIERADIEPLFRTTERGKAHIVQLCCLSWPTEAWLGADGSVIDFD